MKTIGAILVCAGIVWAVIAFNIPTTVEVGGERIGSGIFSAEVPRMTVNNLGLMEQRRNHLMMAGVTIIAGVLLIGFGTVITPQALAQELGHRTCPFCAEKIKAEATVCRFCQREMPSLAEEAAAREAATQLAARQAEQAAAERHEAEARKPKGICPNCEATIAVDSISCPKCKATFGPDAAWRIRPIP